MRAKKKALSKSRRGEIVAELVSLLVPNGDEGDRLTSHSLALSTILSLQTIIREKPLWGFKKANTGAVSKLLKNIVDLRKTLDDMPNEAIFMIAMKDPYPEQVPSFSETQNTNQRLKRMVDMFAYLQARCEHLLLEEPGEHPNVDFKQRLVADEAWRLMRYHNLKPASGIAGSTFGDLANLLFEAVTGEDRNLQRACKEALTRAKAGELRDWQGL